MADFVFRQERSVWLCVPQHAEAEQRLIDLKTGDDGCQWAAAALVVEARDAEHLAAQLEDEGWGVEL